MVRDLRAQKAKDDAEHAALQKEYEAAVRALESSTLQWDRNLSKHLCLYCGHMEDEHTTESCEAAAILSTPCAQAVLKKEGE